MTLFLFAFATILTACAGESQSQQLSLQELMNKSIEASNELKSFSATMEMTQKITSNVEEGPMNVTATINMDVITEPLSMYQTMKMNIPGTDQLLETESYLTDDGFFMYDQTTDKWLKFPDEMYDQIMSLSNAQTDPAKELERLQEYVDEFTMTEDESSYILNVKASGEEMTQFMKETIKENFPEIGSNVNTLDQMSINELDYEFSIDKETYFPNKIKVNMDFEMTVENETVQIIQELAGSYSNLNTIEPIVVPNEVKDSAEEIQF